MLNPKTAESKLSLHCFPPQNDIQNGHQLDLCDVLTLEKGQNVKIWLQIFILLDNTDILAYRSTKSVDIDLDSFFKKGYHNRILNVNMRLVRCNRSIRNIEGFAKTKYDISSYWLITKIVQEWILYVFGNLEVGYLWSFCGLYYWRCRLRIWTMPSWHSWWIFKIQDVFSLQSL